MSEDLDPKLRELYARIPKDEPSAAVDKAILEAAVKPLVVGRSQAWLLSFGAVASVVVVSSLVVYLQTRSPERLQQAVAVRQQTTPASAAIPQAAGISAESPSSSASDEEARAAQRSAELARLRAQFAARHSGGSKAEAVPPPPADLPTVKLHPDSRLAEQQNKADIQALDRLQPDASAEQKMMSAPPVAAVAPAAPAQSLGKMKAMVEPERAAIASVLMEGVSLGMHREDLAALGWGCGQAICSRLISDPRQPDYWGMATVGATQQVLFAKETVKAMTLSQRGVALNNVKMSLEKIGKPSEQECGFGAIGEALVSRRAGGMLLNLWVDGETTVLGVCLAK